MVKKSSTTALKAEDHARQDRLYATGHQYDFVIVGTGSAALTVGCLLAHAGHKICMVEAHDIPGGYLQSFKRGDFYFCAQVHYIWGCGRGGKIHEFLKRIGLENDITFELLDADGYDHVALPDGKRVKIPYGFDRLADCIDAAYPGQKVAVQKFGGILTKLREEMSFLPERKITWLDYVTTAYKVPHLIRDRDKTLKDLFDECGLSPAARAVLAADAGNFMVPPERLSVFPYAGLFGGYNTGAYYPTKHFKYYVDRLASFITAHEGCHIYYETEVTGFDVRDDAVEGVRTKDGKLFRARHYICNMDPQKASHLIGRDRFPAADLKNLSYDYSPSGVVVYLGVKDLDLRDHGFGSHNLWHLEDWDMNAMWRRQALGDFTKPWAFFATPTLHTNAVGTAPPGHQILELATYAEYAPMLELQKKNYAAYKAEKTRVAERLVDIAEKRYIPRLREHIAVKVVGTPTTNEDFVMAPRGNAYGSDMTPENVSGHRLKSASPWKNFHWCNASSGWGGVYGTVSTGMSLYMELTGDRFYDPRKAPCDAEFIAALPRRP